MNEDIFIKAHDAWYEYLYFEPEYDPDAYLPWHEEEEDEDD